MLSLEFYLEGNVVYKDNIPHPHVIPRRGELVHLPNNINGWVKAVEHTYTRAGSDYGRRHVPLVCIILSTEPTP